MKQHEAVIEVMKANGGYATLGLLYRGVLQVPGVEWKSKTHLPPFAGLCQFTVNSLKFVPVYGL